MESKADRKLRGGFYTPEPIAEFLSQWAIQSETESVLEPGCGDGNILLPAAKHLQEVSGGAGGITGVEIYPDEAEKAKNRLIEAGIDADLFEIIEGDFFEYCIEKHRWEKHSFDAVIGNPPFIRYQSFDEDQREKAIEILKSAGLTPTKQMNAWMPFLVGATQLLKRHGGRLAMIVPATLLQVNYAGELRKYLSDNYSRLTVINFDKLVFDGIQEEVVLLLGERDGHEKVGINAIELGDMSDLDSYIHHVFEKDDIIELDHSTEKWTMYYLDIDQIELIRELWDHEAISPVEEFADVNVGVVTGRNAFFVLDAEQVEENGLMEYTRPIVSRSAHLGEGVRFTDDIQNDNEESGRRSFLLDLPPEPKSEFTEKIQEYIDDGEEKEYHKGYKCSLRDPWYEVPSTWVPDGFLLRQIHRYPKFVVNETDATCTDTIHRVNYTGNDSVREQFFAATHNSLTWAFSEIVGRSYGGGVLELEPNEAEELPVPTNNWEKLELDKVHRLLKEDGPEAVLQYTDEILLKQGMDLSDGQIEMLRNIWTKLHERRINRK